MASYIFYEPFYFGIERLLSDPLLSKQGKAGRNSASSCPAVTRSFKPRCVDIHINKLHFL